MGESTWENPVMKTILVPVEESEVLHSMLETALHTAKRFGGYIEGLHVRPALPGVVAAGAAGLVAATPDLVESFERQDEARTETAKKLYDAFLEEKGVPRGRPEGAVDSPIAGWLEEVAPGDDVVGSYGRSFDLIVVGRPVRGSLTPAMATLEAALFESGRPILIAPPQATPTVGDEIVIAWNGSTETARTIGFGMRFLRAAKTVKVLSIDNSMVPGPTGAQMAQYLIRNGVQAEPVDALSNGRGPGEAMLEEAARLGCDLLFKGAYTNSRLRQMIFGGATSYILAETTIPVFMAH